MQISQNLLSENKLSEIIVDVRSQKKVSVFGLNLGERVLLSAQNDGFVCYITDTRENAENVQKDLQSLGKKVALLTSASDDFTYHLMEFGDAGIMSQVSLNDIVWGRVDACVVTADMLAVPLPTRANFVDSTLTIARGQLFDMADLMRELVARGYTRADAVESVGQCAMRGDVLDLFPINCELPVRLYFFDTEIEKITSFNILTQYSVREEEKVFICPNAFVMSEGQIRELKQTLEQQYLSQRARMAKAKDPAEFLSQLSCLNLVRDNLSAAVPRAAWNFLAAFLPITSLLDLLPQGAVVIIDQPKPCHEVVLDYCARVASGVDEGISNGQLVPLHKNLIPDFAQITQKLDNFAVLSFQSIITQNRFFAPQKVYSLDTCALPKLGDDYQAFAQSLVEFLAKNYTIVLCASEAATVEEYYRKLSKTVPCEKVARICDAISGRVNIMVDALYLGACFVADKLLILGSAETRFVRKKDRALVQQMVKVTDRFALPKAGEYVVHATHGIGVCEGITQLNIGSAKRDYVVVSYQNNDKVYVPTEQLDMLGRYIGGDKAPKLSKIGTNTFEKAKERVRASVKELAFDLMKLYREREKSHGEVMMVDDSIMAEFESSFAFTPTPDQECAFEDVYRDLASGKIMDRLVVGDVGFGKTEVAIRASFVAVMSGFQVAVIVPTTILSEQHFHNFSARLKNYGIEVACLNRFRTPAEQKSILADLHAGKINIIIGTHRLLSDDVRFENLGLLVLDEEQRFGVGDKEKLKNVKKNIHVLTLSATPIPRTLHMSLSGIRDISTIETPPLDRLPVQTVVSQFSYTLAATAINRELGRNGQTLVVYPRIENIEVFANSLRANLGTNIRIGVAHGRMEKTRIEDTILALYQGEIDVLVATTLIENGIDLPNANTLFVVEADKLGLSQLYQLRGRVGRSDRLAWAYFTYMDEGKLSGTAYERLSILMQFTSLGSGFKIAMRDLELRGAGNILGAEQHGQMEKVGYDMYCKLLNSSVAAARGDPDLDKKPVKIEVDIDAFVPKTFEADESKRMEIYSAIASITSSDDAAQVRAKIADTYGALPAPVEGLVCVATLKAKCQILGVERVSVTRQKSTLYVANSNIKLLNLVGQSGRDGFSVYKKDNMVIITQNHSDAAIDEVWSSFFDYLDGLIAKVV